MRFFWYMMVLIFAGIGGILTFALFDWFVIPFCCKKRIEKLIREEERARELARNW